MADFELVTEKVTIVLVGSFNPTICHPAWFAANNLIKDEESESAELEITHPQVCIFNTDWMRLDVSQERFLITTTQKAYFEVLRDLFLGTFSLLSHTPTIALGLNFDYDIVCKDKDSWNKFGHTVAPKEIWSDVLDKPGLLNMVTQGSRADEHPGYIQVRISSNKDSSTGITIGTNHHLNLSALNDGKALSAGEALKFFNETWQVSLEKSQSIYENLIKHI